MKIDNAQLSCGLPAAPVTNPASNRKRPRPKAGNTSVLTVFWALCGVLLVYVVWTCGDRPLRFTLSGLLVSACALLPSYLWCAGGGRGLPIWPLSCAASLITYAIQLLASYARFQDVGTKAIWTAALTVAGFLVIGTIVWRFWLNKPSMRPASCLMIRTENVDGVLLCFLAFGAVYTMCSTAGWMTFLPGGVATAVRGFMRGPTAFAVFVLGSRWGGRSLNSSQVVWLLLLVMFYLFADAASLYLISSIATGLMFLVGYAIGKRAIPWMMSGVFVVVLGALHLGKGEMRTEYWGEDLSDRTLVKPWEYPAFFSKWFQCSVNAVSSGKARDGDSESILERANTIYLLFEAQEMSPSEAPFLHGATYAIIPASIVPRIFWAQKVSPHDSTSLLNVHYGNQTWEAAQVTSIGWGLLNEAYANFGYAGCAGLAVALGTFYGLLTRWSIGFPSTSMRTFIGIFTMSFAIQTEMSAAVYISAYLQGLVALWVAVRIFATRQSLQPVPKIASGGLKTGTRSRGRRRRNGAGRWEDVEQKQQPRPGYAGI